MSTTSFSASPLSQGKWHFLCVTLAWTATITMVALPLCNTFQILFPAAWLHLFPASWEVPAPKVNNTYELTVVPLAYRAAILACGSVTMGLAIWAFWSVRQLFVGFAQGEVFTARALSYLNHIALALLLGEVAGIVLQLPETALATWYLGRGHRSMDLSLGTDDIVNLLLAGGAFVIARVMAEARRIADDNAGII